MSQKERKKNYAWDKAGRDVGERGSRPGIGSVYQYDDAGFSQDVEIGRQLANASCVLSSQNNVCFVFASDPDSFDCQWIACHSVVGFGLFQILDVTGHSVLENKFLFHIG